MQPSGNRQAGNPFGQPASNSPAGRGADQGRKRAGRGRAGCLIWTLVFMLCLGLAALVVVGAAYAGWNSGVGIARENATSTAAAAVVQQCDRLRLDVERGNSQRLPARIEYLQLQTPAPPCLNDLLPAATALSLQSIPSAAIEPTSTWRAIATSADSPVIRATYVATVSSAIEYDLDALLSEAQRDIGLQDYRSAIDTLDAIIGIDVNYQRDHVSSLFFSALTAEAEILFRTGNLSEAIVMTARAESHGDVGGLNYERHVAETYLNGLRLKVANPGESVQLFNIVVYQLGHGDYRNGQVLTELQEALRNYGDAFAFQGDHCLARDQYEAALNLNPARSNILRGTVTAKRDDALAVCPVAPANQAGPAAASNSEQPVGVGRRPSPVPVGQNG